MKRIVKSSLIIIILLLLVTGCGKDNIEIVNMEGTTSKRSENPLYNINVNGSGTLECTRAANAYNGLTASFNYAITYKHGIITFIHSIEKVKGDSSSALDEYEEAYNKIKDRYSDIKYYDITVTRDTNSVIYDSKIDYEKVDMNKILKLEGNENNIYNSSNKIELKKWYSFVKKIGTTCKGV